MKPSYGENSGFTIVKNEALAQVNGGKGNSKPHVELRDDGRIFGGWKWSK